MRYPYWRLGLLVVSLLSVFAIAAACGGDDDDGGDDPDPTATTSTGENGNDNDGETPEATEEVDEGDALEDLREAAANRPSRFYAKYDVSSEGATEEETFSGTIVLAADDPREVITMEIVEGGIAGRLTVISDDESSYFCSTEEGTDEGTCLKSPADESLFGDLTGALFTTDDVLEEITGDDSVDVRRAGSKNIAGLNTECYDYSGDDGEGTICLAREQNVMAEVVGTMDGTDIEFRLTEWDDDPDDSLFEPPYEVVDFGG